MKIAKLDWFEVEELAIKVCNLPEDSGSEAIEEALFEKFEIDFEQFHKLAATLVPLCMIAESPLTNKVYRGFGADGVWLARQEVPNTSTQQEPNNV